MDIAPIIREALELWNNPAFTALPPETITNCVNRRIGEHLLDLDLTPDACFATKRTAPFTFDLASRERPLPFGCGCDDLSRIIRVEARAAASTNEDEWFEVSVASFEDWSESMSRNDGFYCAFYRNDGPIKMMISREMSAFTVRIVYKVLKDMIEANDAQAPLPTVYHSLLVYDLAMEIGPIIDDRSAEFAPIRASKMVMLKARYTEAYERVEKWRRSQRSTTVARRRGFNDRAYAPHTRFRPALPGGIDVDNWEQTDW